MRRYTARRTSPSPWLAPAFMFRSTCARQRPHAYMHGAALSCPPRWTCRGAARSGRQPAHVMPVNGGSGGTSSASDTRSNSGCESRLRAIHSCMSTTSVMV